MDEQLAQLRADVERASAPRVVVARAAVLRLLDEVAIRRPVQDLDALTGYTPPRPEPRRAAAAARRVVQPPPGRGRAILAVTGEDAARLAQAAWETAPADPHGHDQCIGDLCRHPGAPLWGPWDTTLRLDLRCDLVQAARRALTWLVEHPR